MAATTGDKFELLVSVRSDRRLLASSVENSAIFSAVRNEAYPPIIPESTPDSPLFRSALYLPHLHQKRLVDAARFFGWNDALKHLTEGGPLASPAHFDTWVRDRLQIRSLSDTGGEDDELPQKLRILLSSTGTLSLEAAPVPPVASIKTFFPPNLPNPRIIRNEQLQDASEGWPGEASWSVTLDASPIIPTGDTADPHLHFKTTHRDVYDVARARIPKRTANDTKHKDAKQLLDEILLYTEDGYITEGSLTSVYFWRDEHWVTPRCSSSFLTEEDASNAKAGAQSGTTRLYALAKGLAVEGDVHKDSVQSGEVIWLSNGVRGFGWGVIYQ